MRRKTDRTRQDKNRLQQLRRLSFTIRPMIEATHLRVFWVSRICRYRWLIRLTFPHLGIASLAQVSKTGLCPLPEISLANYCKKGSLGHHVQVCKHTHTHTYARMRFRGSGALGMCPKLLTDPNALPASNLSSKSDQEIRPSDNQSMSRYVKCLSLSLAVPSHASLRSLAQGCI